ncbi:MAG: Trk system potassium transporter TrkA, partial [Candidatus Thermoplasmatota archaeon]
DLYVGVTGYDEVNMISSSFAKSKGVKTIARINKIEYIDKPISIDEFRWMGIDIAICPDLVAANRMARILITPTLLDVEQFGKGKIYLLHSKVYENAWIANKQLKDAHLPVSCDIISIYRGGNAIIPSGKEIIYPFDEVIAVIGQQKDIPKVGELLGHKTNVLKEELAEKIMIVGATRTGIHLAKMLENNATISLIDNSEERCAIASEILTNTTVVRGSATEKELLMSENVGAADAFVATTEREGVNTIACLLAKKLGAKIAIALIDHLELKTTLHDMGIDLLISPRIATVNEILRYAATSGSITSLSILHSGEARIIEAEINQDAKIAGKKISKISLPNGVVAATIVRGEEVIIPHGDTIIEVGDRVLFYVKTEATKKLEKLL